MEKAGSIWVINIGTVFAGMWHHRIQADNTRVAMISAGIDSASIAVIEYRPVGI